MQILLHTVLDSSALEKLVVALLQDACQETTTVGEGAEATDESAASGLELMQRVVSGLWDQRHIRQAHGPCMLAYGLQVGEKHRQEAH